MRRYMALSVLVLALVGSAGCYAGPELEEGSLSGSYLLLDEETDSPVAGIEALSQDGDVVGQSNDEGQLDVTIDGAWIEGLELAMFTLRDPQGRYAGQYVFVTAASADLQSRIQLAPCTPELCAAP